MSTDRPSGERAGAAPERASGNENTSKAASARPGSGGTAGSASTHERPDWAAQGASAGAPQDLRGEPTEAPGHYGPGYGDMTLHTGTSDVPQAPVGGTERPPVAQQDAPVARPGERDAPSRDADQ